MYDQTLRVLVLDFPSFANSSNNSSILKGNKKKQYFQVKFLNNNSNSGSTQDVNDILLLLEHLQCKLANSPRNTRVAREFASCSLLQNHHAPLHHSHIALSLPLQTCL
jgi:hypothetical protein